MAANSSKVWLSFRQSRKSGAETGCSGLSPQPFARFIDRTIITLSGSFTGGFLSKTPLTTLKIAVLAAIPSPSVMTATAVKPGFFASMRRPYFKSWNNVFIRILSVELSAISYQRSATAPTTPPCGRPSLTKEGSCVTCPGSSVQERGGDCCPPLSTDHYPLTTIHCFTRISAPPWARSSSPGAPECRRRGWQPRPAKGRMPRKPGYPLG